MIRVGVVGQVVIDRIIATVGHSETMVSSTTPMFTEFGGKAFNIAAAFEKIGFETMLISAIGNDDESQKVRAAITEAGINDELLLSASTADARRVINTPSAYLTEGRFGERKVHIKTDERLHTSYVRACKRAKKWAKDFDVLVFTLEFDDILLSAVSDLIREVKASNPNALIVGNPAPRRTATENPHPHVAELLHLADGLTPNRYEATSLLAAPDWKPDELKRDDYVTHAKRLAQIYGVDWCVVTLGKHGWAWWHSKFQGGSSQIRPAKLKNKVGASDVFTAVLCAALYLGDHITVASTIAATSARLAVSRSGGVERFPNGREIMGALRRMHNTSNSIANSRFCDWISR